MNHSSNRRDFLKESSIAGIGMLVSGSGLVQAGKDKDCNDLNEELSEEYWHEPSYDWDYVHVGEYYDAGRQLKYYSEVVRLNPGCAKAWFKRGRAHHHVGETYQEDRDYGKAIRLDPDFYYARFWRGQIYEMFGHFDLAFKEMSEVVRRRPEMLKSWLGRGEQCVRGDLRFFPYCMSGGGLGQAIRDFTEAMRLRPMLPRGLEGRARCYRGIGDWCQAIRDYSELIRLDPDDVRWWAERGMCFQNTGDFDQAIKDYNKAFELDPSYYSYGQKDDGGNFCPNYAAVAEKYRLEAEARSKA